MQKNLELRSEYFAGIEAWMEQKSTVKIYQNNPSEIVAFSKIDIVTNFALTNEKKRYILYL